MKNALLVNTGNLCHQVLASEFTKLSDVTVIRSSVSIKLILRFLEGHTVRAILVSHETAPLGRPVV